MPRLGGPAYLINRKATQTRYAEKATSGTPSASLDMRRRGFETVTILAFPCKLRVGININGRQAFPTPFSGN